jgi:hypothetical protein
MMKGTDTADNPEKGVLVRKGDTYKVRKKSKFNGKNRPDSDYNLTLTEKLLIEGGKEYISFLMDVTPALSAKPQIYLDALKNVLGGSYVEMADSNESMVLGESSCISCRGGNYEITTGAIGFSGRYNNEEVKGRIGAMWMVSHDMVRVDVEQGAEPNKEFLSSVRKALIGIKPEIDKLPGFLTLESLMKPPERFERPKRDVRNILPIKC